MEALYYILIELFVIAVLLIGLHATRKTYGIGMLLVFLGAIQFFQTILSGNVYNVYFDSVVFSPGSSIIYTSSLFGIFLIYYTEGKLSTRSAIFGLIFSNIIITILSYITLEQIFVDNKSINTEFLKDIFNFDLNLFITGTTILFLDAVLILIIFKKLLKTIFKNIYLNLFITLSLVSTFDSVTFYSINFFQEKNFSDFLLGSVVGKLIACLFFSITVGTYITIGKLKYKEKQFKDIFFFG